MRYSQYMLQNQSDGTKSFHKSLLTKCSRDQWVNHLGFPVYVTKSIWKWTMDFVCSWISWPLDCNHIWYTVQSTPDIDQVVTYYDAELIMPLILHLLCDLFGLNYNYPFQYDWNVTDNRYQPIRRGFMTRWCWLSETAGSVLPIDPRGPFY